jgi:hypothetical protein
VSAADLSERAKYLTKDLRPKLLLRDFTTRHSEKSMLRGSLSLLRPSKSVKNIGIKLIVKNIEDEEIDELKLIIQNRFNVLNIYFTFSLDDVIQKWKSPVMDQNDVYSYKTHFQFQYSDSQTGTILLKQNAYVVVQINRITKALVKSNFYL